MGFYKFSQLTGKLTQFAHLRPLFPISPRPLEKAAPTKMIYDTIHTQPAKVQAAGSVSTSSSVSPKLLRIYEQYQKKAETTPVFLLAGARDKILFGITATAIGVNAIVNITFLVNTAMQT